MSKRTKKNKGNQPAQNDATDTTVIENVADTTVAENNDNAEVVEVAEAEVAEDVLAALAANEPPAAAVTTDAETEVTADDVDEPTEDEVLAAIDASDKPARKKREAKEPAQPMREFTAVAQIDQDTLTANLDGCNAKKVREKADNLIASITHGKKLSRYTALAVKELKENGRISGKSMTERFKTEGLGEGTARAQAQQMTALFKLVGAVAPDQNAPRDLVVQDNRLIEELATLAA